jgi:hypothetical protein
MTHDDTMWFKARRYGWGWGAATTWQGWAVYAVFTALIVLNAVAFPPDRHLAAFLACLSMLTTALIGICATKGERPHWRWGGR